jgi:hypothetical protein
VNPEFELKPPIRDARGPLVRRPGRLKRGLDKKCRKCEMCGGNHKYLGVHPIPRVLGGCSYGRAARHTRAAVQMMSSLGPQQTCVSREMRGMNATSN